MAGVMNPGQRRTLLDQVSQGLSIASQVYGIKSAMDEGEYRDEQRAKAAETEKRVASGAKTEGEIQDLKLLKGFQDAKQGEEGATELALMGGGKTWLKKPTALTPPKTEKMGDTLLTWNPKTGKYEEAYKGTPKQEVISVDTGEEIKLVPKVAGASYTKTKKERSPDDDKLARELADKINPSRGRSGELGKIQARLNSADRVLGLALDEDGNPRALTKGEMTELASSVASMISNGGVASQHVIDSMTPSSFSGDIAQQVSYVLNKVDPADMTEFVSRLAHTAERERDISNDQKMQAMAQTVASYHDLRERQPELWARIIKSAKLNPEDFDENSIYAPKAKEKAPKKEGGEGLAVAGPGGKTPASAPLHPQANDAAAWANANRLSPDPVTAQKAQEILKRLNSGAKQK